MCALVTVLTCLECYCFAHTLFYDGGYGEKKCVKNGIVLIRTDTFNTALYQNRAKTELAAQC